LVGVALDQLLGGAEGLVHRAIGEEGDKAALKQLAVLRIVLDRLAQIDRGRPQVAGRTGDYSRQIVAFETLGRLEFLDRARLRERGHADMQTCDERQHKCGATAVDLKRHVQLSPSVRPGAGDWSVDGTVT
jgi:hypothetical protein